MKWNEFKSLIKMLRREQELLMRRQRGSNHIMYGIFVYSEEDGDFISFPPHRMNLKDGTVHASTTNGKFKKFNIKEILKNDH